VLSAGGDVGIGAVSCIVTLTAGDTVEFWLNNTTNTNDVTIQNAQLWLHEVGAAGSGAGLDINSLTASTDITQDADYVALYDAGLAAHRKLLPIDLTRAGVNAQTGTSYTAVLSDREKVITMANAAANTFTIPANASVAYATGTTLTIIQYGAGTTSVAGDTGVTVNGVSAGSADLDAQYTGVATALKVDTDAWILFGAHGGVA